MMRMLSQPPGLVALCLAFVLVVSFLVANAAGVVGGGVANGPATSPGDDRDRLMFPYLTRLRDTIVEAVFNRRPPPAAPPREPRAPTYADVQRVYSKYVVVRYAVTTADDEEALAHAVDQMFLDVWAVTPGYVDIRIGRKSIASLATLLPSSLVPTVLIPDVAELVWGTYPSSRSNRGLFLADPARDAASAQQLLNKWAGGMDDLFFRDFQPLSVIDSWMHLVQNMFPAHVEMLSIGKSYEGRDISALRVGNRGASGTNAISRGDDGSGGADEPRMTILVTGGLHGREWISTSTVNYLAWSVITAYDQEPMVTKLLDRFDIVFVPNLNPDGYEFTWRRDRLWRKSRQQTKMRYCRGIDLDHAFGYEWSEGGGGGDDQDGSAHKDLRRRRWWYGHEDPCSESYGGDGPFQATEASALAAWARNETTLLNRTRLVGFLDLHSYSQEVLFPYSFSCDAEPPNLENLEELAAGLAKAIRLSSGESYSVMSACEGAAARGKGGGSFPRVESGGGSAIDWFYHELHARYSYQIKLRDTGSYGFLLPSNQIVPTGEEVLNAFKYFGDFLLGNNGIEKP